MNEWPAPVQEVAESLTIFLSSAAVLPTAYSLSRDRSRPGCQKDHRRTRAFPQQCCGNDRADVLSLNENTMSAYAFVCLGRQTGGGNSTEMHLKILYHSLRVNTNNR